MNSYEMGKAGVVVIVIGFFLLFCNGGGIAALILFGIVGIALLIGASNRGRQEDESFEQMKNGNSVDKYGKSYYDPKKDPLYKK